MNNAQQIIATTSNATDAMDAAERIAIAKDQVWQAELTKYTFDDNSVLAISGPDRYAMDANDANSIKGYAKWLGGNVEHEAAEVDRLLAAVEG